jgi:hypothetical protein
MLFCAQSWSPCQDLLFSLFISVRTEPTHLQKPKRCRSGCISAQSLLLGLQAEEDLCSAHTHLLCSFTARSAGWLVERLLRKQHRPS